MPSMWGWWGVKINVSCCRPALPLPLCPLPEALPKILARKSTLHIDAFNVLDIRRVALTTGSLSTRSSRSVQELGKYIKLTLTTSLP